MRTSDPDVFEVEGPPSLPAAPDKVIAALSHVVTKDRLLRIQQVASMRTNAITLVLDSLADPHNISAILRSADAFGIQKVHVIPGEHGFHASRGVSKGSQRWLDIHIHNESTACVRALREQGYKIYIATMQGEHSLPTLSTHDRIALVFGNEHCGVSPELHELSDGTFSIPMRGFVESLNVSVAAAISLYTLNQKLHAPLNTGEQKELIARFLMNSVRDAEAIIRDYQESDQRSFI